MRTTVGRTGYWGKVFWVVTVGLVIASPQVRADEPARYVPTAAELQEGYQRAHRDKKPLAPVYKTRIEPHWFADNHRFWYRNDLAGGAKEFIAVDVEAGRRRHAFDHIRLASALSRAAGHEYRAEELPFDKIEFVADETAVRFRAAEADWQCDLTSYACTHVRHDASGRIPNPVGPPAQLADAAALSEEIAPDPFADPAPQPERPGRGRDGAPPPTKSPDGKWTAFVKDHNLWLRPTASGPEIRLSTDGRDGNAYAMPRWAPDSKALAAFRVEPGDRKEVYLVETSPRGGGRAVLHRRPYALPGDKLTAYELNLFQVDPARQIKPRVDRDDLGPPRLHWDADGRRCTIEKVDRGHQRFRLTVVDARTGEARELIDEKSQTFIWTTHVESLGLDRVRWLEKTPEFLYTSEWDGWRHLYLVDARDGGLKHQITRGEYVVRTVLKIDEDNRQIWFEAGGRNPGQDPYFLHCYRVNFDGSGLVALTEGDGTHSVQFSPDRKYLIDSYSRVDLSPVHELRRTSDGRLVCALEKADASKLEAGGWKPPEVFVAKGRDGKTDIWGIICRPRNFDPAKKYPVVEAIYAGPHGSFVPKSFSANERFPELTELGFIVVQIDGMGTANRSKAFQDVCWKNLKDAGFPDRILWHRAAAKKYSYYDITRVGIYGTSAGGQNAAGAVLFHPEFYHAAVAACGCHDNRMDKASWNEQWMGYPVGPQYAECSNVTHAANLRGKLLLLVGEMDTNVPPESTYRLVDALIRAGKDFEFLAVPGLGHSNGGTYGVRRMQDFFVRHLHGVAPPDHNAEVPDRRKEPA